MKSAPSKRAWIPLVNIAQARFPFNRIEQKFACKRLPPGVRTFRGVTLLGFRPPVYHVGQWRSNRYDNGWSTHPLLADIFILDQIFSDSFMGLIVATKAFFKLLANRELSNSFQQLLDGKLTPRIEATVPKSKSVPASPQPTPTTPKPTRSEALTLLAALQREARLLDIINEPLDGFSDSQIGAAARDVLKNSGAVIARIFGVEPLTAVADGARLTTPAKFDPAQFRLTGKVSGEAPFQGIVAHQGWKATRCEIPQWTGSAAAALIVAPIELEIG